MVITKQASGLFIPFLNSATPQVCVCVDKPGTLSAGDIISSPTLNDSRSSRLFLDWNHSLHSFLVFYWCKYTEA
jgi:hypothetical protein